MKKILSLGLLSLFVLQIEAAELQKTAELQTVAAQPASAKGMKGLNTDKYLLPGDYITNGSNFLVLQTDGNLCLRTSPTGGTAIWCNMVPGSGPRFLTQQGDGNLCVYNGTPTSRGSGIWCSRNVSAPYGNYVTQINSANNAICTYPSAVGKLADFGVNSIWCSN